jgi:hypothetical protein
MVGFAPSKNQTRLSRNQNLNEGTNQTEGALGWVIQEQQIFTLPD